jgi:hypothetical protein
MRIDDFWHMVEQTRREAHGEPAALAALTMRLQRLGEPAIAAFERHVREEVAVLDTPELRDIATQLWVLSEDNWLHFRAWCVSQGPQFGAQLRKAPGSVLRRVAAEGGGPFDIPNGELFLYCAEYARVARARAVA